MKRSLLTTAALTLAASASNANAASVTFGTNSNPTITANLGEPVQLTVYVSAVTGKQLASINWDLAETSTDGGDVSATAFQFAPGNFSNTTAPTFNTASFFVENVKASDFDGNNTVGDTLTAFGTLSLTPTAVGTVELFFAKDSSRWGENPSPTDSPIQFGFGDAPVAFANTGTGSAAIGTRSTLADATIVVVPEPASAALIGAAAVGLAARRRRSQR